MATNQPIDSGIIERFGTQEIAPSAGTGEIAFAVVNRAFEKLGASLPPASEGEANYQLGDAFAQARARHNEPAVALVLAELMMTSPDREVRTLAEQALVDTADDRARTLLQAEYMIRKLSEGGGKFGSGPEDADQLVVALKKLRKDPFVAARLVETVTSGDSAAYFAAIILQGTSDQATLEALKGALTQALDGGFQTGWERRNLWQVPRALKNSTDPNAQALIIRTFKEGDEAYDTNNLRHQAARALGAINTDQVHALVTESVIAPRQDWHVRSGVAEAIRELNVAQVDEKLLPLIEGTASQTSWIIAGERSATLAGRVGVWIGIMTSEQREIHDIRVQVGLALRDRHPDVAAKVFYDVLKGKLGAFPPLHPRDHRCQFFAAADAWNAIREIESKS